MLIAKTGYVPFFVKIGLKSAVQVRCAEVNGKANMSSFVMLVDDFTHFQFRTSHSRPDLVLLTDSLLTTRKVLKAVLNVFFFS